MGTRGGKLGAVNGQSTVRNWTISDDKTNPQFRASNTKAGTGRRAGINMWSGGFAGYGGNPVLMPAEVFTFLGYTAPDNGVSGAGERYSGEAIIDSLAVNWNWQGGELINNTYAFSGHLGLTVASGAVVTDATIPAIDTICGVIFEYSLDGVAWEEIENLASATLNITAVNQGYVNSSTNCNTGRQSGPIDWTLSMVQQEVVRGLYPFDKGDNIQIRAYINDTDFWLLKWGLVKNFTGITVDVEANTIIQRTINVEMNGFVGGAVGNITKPGAGAAWWPL